MKRLLMSLSALVLTLGAVCGQTVKGSWYNSVGTNFSALFYDNSGVFKTQKLLPGVTAGVGYAIPFSAKSPFSFETGLRYNLWGGIAATGENFDQIEVNYLSVPVMIDYHIWIDHSVCLVYQTGVMVSYGFAGKERLWGLFDDIMVSKDDPWIHDPFGESFFQMRRFDVGAVAAAGISYGAVGLKVGFSCGLMNALNPNNEMRSNHSAQLINRSLFIEFFYNFL